MSEQISDRESFENGYHYFVLALKAVAAAPTAQKKMYGATSAGISWELKQDVLAGTYMFNLESCSLSGIQRDQILELVRQFEGVPVTADLYHPSWVPLRVKAAELLIFLEPVTRANMSYFVNGEASVERISGA